MEDAIKAVAVQDDRYGEKVVLDSPFDAKDFIKVMPWKEYSEEIEEYGSLRAKAESRASGELDKGVEIALNAAEDFGFSDDFAAHPSWDPNGLGYEDGAWTVDAESWDESRLYFEHCGFDVEVRGDVSL